MTVVFTDAKGLNRRFSETVVTKQNGITSKSTAVLIFTAIRTTSSMLDREMAINCKGFWEEVVVASV
jgi:hypothetical protein